MRPRLCESTKGHWYAIFCDNFFTSYKLTEDLYRDKILCCGTVRSGQKKFPPCIFDKASTKSMERGDLLWRMKGPVLAVTWMDNKPVHATGTYTQTPLENLPEVNRKQKDGNIQGITYPQLAASYNSYMGGVNKNDQMKSYYPTPVSGKKWWSRTLFDLIDRCIFNSFVLEQESPNHGKRTQEAFHIDLVKELIGDFSSRRKLRRPSDEPLLARHVDALSWVPPTNESGKRKERCKDKLYGCYLPDDHSVYLDYQRTVRNVTISRVAKELEKNYSLCCGVIALEMTSKLFHYLIPRRRRRRGRRRGAVSTEGTLEGEGLFDCVQEIWAGVLGMLWVPYVCRKCEEGKGKASVEAGSCECSCVKDWSREDRADSARAKVLVYAITQWLFICACPLQQSRLHAIRNFKTVRWLLTFKA